MAAELRDALGIEADLVAGAGGTFDVTVDGKLIFSKAQTGRFPEPGEVAGLVRKLKGATVGSSEE